MIMELSAGCDKAFCFAGLVPRESIGDLTALRFFVANSCYERRFLPALVLEKKKHLKFRKKHFFFFFSFRIS